MTVAEFLAWAQAQPGDDKYELIDGVPVLKHTCDDDPLIAMAPERFAHAEPKFDITAKLKIALPEGKIRSQAIIDGLGVKVDETTTYIPDVVVNCGDPLQDDDEFAPTPVIVVEIISPSSRRKETSAKLLDYFRVPSIQHYLVFDLERRLVVRHIRGEGETIVTGIVKEGMLRLDPPGIEIGLDGVFGDAGM